MLGVLWLFFALNFSYKVKVYINLLREVLFLPRLAAVMDNHLVNKLTYNFRFYLLNGYIPTIFKKRSAFSILSLSLAMEVSSKATRSESSCFSCP